MAINWNALKIDYNSQDYSLNELCEKYKCKIATLERKIEKECWTIKQFDSELDSVEEVLDSHKQLWRIIRKKAELVSSKDTGELTLKDLKVEADIFSSVIKGERTAWGLDKEESKGEDKVDWLNVFKQMEETTVLRRAAEDLSRE